MNATTHRRDDLMPPTPDKRGQGLLLALGMHAVLIIGLTIGVNWKSSAPDAVEAELWAAVPQAAAPAPPPPPPPKPVVEEKPKPEPKPPQPVERPEPDRSAEIALEKERKQREKEKRGEAEKREKEEQRKREEAEKLKKEEAEKRKLEEQRKAKELERKRLAEEQEKRMQAQREERLRQLMNQAGTGTQQTGAAQGGAAGSPSASYAGKLRAHIRPHIVFSDTLAGNPAAEVEVRASPTGSILSSRLVKSSGNAEWDDAVLRAVEKAQTLPKDENGRIWSPIIITFRPKDM